MIWLITIFSLVGTVLNIRKNNICFVFWIFTNSFWAILDFQKGIYQQSMLMLIYLFLSIWGLLEWRKK